MRRREFIALVGSAAAAWPHAARAGKLPTIGVLGSDAPGWSAWTAAFVQRLHELGWIEGRIIAIEYRWSEGRSDRVADIPVEQPSRIRACHQSQDRQCAWPNDSA